MEKIKDRTVSSRRRSVLAALGGVVFVLGIVVVVGLMDWLGILWIIGIGVFGLFMLVVLFYTIYKAVIER